MKQFLCCCLVLGFSIAAVGQSRDDSSYQIFAGYTRLSNSFNGLPGKEHGLDGWETSLGFPSTHGMRLVLDYVSFNGTNQGASQQGTFIMGGGQYERLIGQEGIFVEGLAGEANLNQNWYNNGGLVSTASFPEFAGGGFDTPLTHSLAFRVEGGVQHTNFALMRSKKVSFPYYRPAGLPDNFARLTAGVVWTRARSAAAEEKLIREEEDPARHMKDSELVFPGESSFGHYTIFAVDKYTHLQLAGVEYDRHTWGRFLGAQMDYVGEILPLDTMMANHKKLSDMVGEGMAHLVTSMEGKTISMSESDLFVFVPRMSYVPDSWLTASPDFWGKK
ncbi:MAG: hypothetical protein ACP5M4_03050 [Acidobacteriaceae bacterium]